MPYRKRSARPRRNAPRARRTRTRPMPKSRYQRYIVRRYASMRPHQPFMRDTYCKLRYNDTATLASTAGAIAIRTYSMNSLYDPDQTGTGHQPRFYDTLCGADNTAAPYGKYRVLSAKIKVRFMNANAGVTSLGYCGIHIRNEDSSTLTSASYIPEIPHTKYRMLNVSTGMSNFLSVVYPVSIKKYLGVKDLKDAPETGAEYSASPTDMVLADIFYYPRDGTTTASILLDIYIEYVAQFFDQNLPDDS